MFTTILLIIIWSIFFAGMSMFMEDVLKITSPAFYACYGAIMIIILYIFI